MVIYLFFFFLLNKWEVMPLITSLVNSCFFSFLFSAKQAAVTGGKGAFPGLPERRDTDCRRWGFLQRCAQLLWGKNEVNFCIIFTTFNVCGHYNVAKVSIVEVTLFHVVILSLSNYCLCVVCLHWWALALFIQASNKWCPKVHNVLVGTTFNEERTLDR